MDDRSTTPLAAMRVGYREFTALFRRTLVLRARDITDRTAARRTLLLAPHPDDETIGCGATLARKRAAGAYVHVCVATDGGASQRAAELGRAVLADLRVHEALAACAVLGIERADVTFFGFHDGALAAGYERLEECVAEALNELRPEELVVPCGIDIHPDHRALYEAGVRAHRRSGSDASVLAYPVHFWRPSAWTDPDASRGRTAVQQVVRPIVACMRLRPRVVRTDEYLAVKERALDAYREEFGSYAWIARERFLAEYLRSEELFFEIHPAGRRIGL